MKGAPSILFPLRNYSFAMCPGLRQIMGGTSEAIFSRKQVQAVPPPAGLGGKTSFKKSGKNLFI